MAHPETEAQNNNITPTHQGHATRSLTLEQAADELEQFFDETPDEQAFQKKEYDDQQSLAEDVKRIKLDKNNDIDFENSTLEFENDDPYDGVFDDLVEDMIADEATNPDDQEQEFDEGQGTDENSAIPAPVSWSKEHQKVFDTLPPDAKEIIVDREREREKGFQVKTTEIAEERRQLQALETQTMLERQMYADGLSERLAGQITTPDQTMMDPMSPSYNPGQFYADQRSYEQNVAQQEFLQQRARGYELLAADNKRMADVQSRHLNQERITELIPEWGDENARHGMLSFGAQYGFSSDDIQSASPAEVMLLSKAMKYDEMVAEKPALQSRLKKAPKVQKPGAKSRGNSTRHGLAQAKKKLKQTGSVEDAAAVLSYIL